MDKLGPGVSTLAGKKAAPYLQCTQTVNLCLYLLKQRKTVALYLLSGCHSSILAVLALPGEKQLLQLLCAGEGMLKQGPAPSRDAEGQQMNLLSSGLVP